MSMVAEFKDFAMRGNVVDMAVGIVIGGAFGKIVSSFVANVLMPPIGLLLGGVDFSDLAITLSAATADAEAVLLSYGVFIQTVVDFLIIASAIFLVVKAMNMVMTKEEAPAPEPAPPEPSKEENSAHRNSRRPALRITVPATRAQRSRPLAGILG